MHVEEDRLPYEEPMLVCLAYELGIIKGFSERGEENNGDDVEQPTGESELNEDPLG